MRILAHPVLQRMLKFSGGRHMVHPPPEYVVVMQTNEPNLFITDWKNLPAPYVAKLAELNCGGGGWINQGPKMGTYVERGGYTEWVLRCSSRSAWGCMNQIKIQFYYMTKNLTMLNSAGRPHKHEGEFKLSRGLSPQVKELIKNILFNNARIQLRCAAHPSNDPVEHLAVLPSPAASAIGQGGGRAADHRSSALLPPISI